MSTIEQVDHPAAWTAASLSARSDAWTCRLSDEDVDELERALHQVETRGLLVPRFGSDAFAIPRLEARLAPFREELNLGLGVLSITGLPVTRYTKDQASAIFWGLGSHFGRPWAQNMRGHLLGDVIDEGKTVDDPTARGYQTTAALEMHTDGADLVALLCLKQAPEGGEFRFVSAMSVFNRLADTHPDVLQHLLDTQWCIDWRAEEAPGELPWHRGCVYERIPGGVACLALIGYIFSAQRHADVPRLSDFDRAALEAFQAASQDPDLVFRVHQQPGDILFLNNHFHMHGRSTFRDAEDPRERRHLRRLWLESPYWSGRRPRVMERILRNARSWWDKPDSTVQMWDRS